MRKIVINCCFGGFGLSERAYTALGLQSEHSEIDRDDPRLVAIVEQLGHLANGFCAELKVVEIPDDVDWGIHDYDGQEHIYEKHRTWR